MLSLLREFRFQLRTARRLVFHYPHLLLDQTDYDAYWDSKRAGRMGDLSDFQRRRCDTVATDLEEGASILDIGCGDGAVLLHLRERRKLKAYAADISQKALDSLSVRGGRPSAST